MHARILKTLIKTLIDRGASSVREIVDAQSGPLRSRTPRSCKIHRAPCTIVATDGVAVPESARIAKDTVNVAPGERYDVIWQARERGRWLLHCHINHHTTNDNQEEAGAGGLTLIIEVE